MTGFRLADLDPILLEKVITKFEPKSYFRVQQTCRGMHDFIRRNKNISIHLDGNSSFIKRCKKLDGSPLTWVERPPGLNFDENGCKLNFAPFRSWDIYIGDLYGTRLPSLAAHRIWLCRENEDDTENFDRICDCLRKQRITVEEIDFNLSNWIKDEEKLKFLSIVKPRKVTLGHVVPSENEWLFKSASIHSVKIALNTYDVAFMTQKLLLAFSDVDIVVRYAEDHFDLIRTLQHIHFVEMTDFRLADLDPILLEQVITKLEPKSYFRIQQTCRGVSDFIGRNKNISIHLHKDYCFIKRDTHTGSPINWLVRRPGLGLDENGGKLYFYCYNWEICIANLYGTRLPSLAVYNVSSFAKLFDRICDSLKKYRITVEEVDFRHSRWTKEEKLKFLSIIKPCKVTLGREVSNQYEGLLKLKPIKGVKIELNHEDVTIETPKLLSACSDVDIKVHNADGHFDLLRTCLQILRSQPWPDLCRFNFCVYGARDVYPSFAELKNIFHEYHLTVGEYHIVVEMPQHFFATASCHIVISRRFTSLYCGCK